MVMALQTQATKARATKRTTKGAKAPERKALANNSPLQVALCSMKTSRKSKPRETGVMDEAVWEGSVATVMGRIRDKFSISDLDGHYASMCALGQTLLAAEIHREAQSLYDYRAGKLVYRANRRKT